MSRTMSFLRNVCLALLALTFLSGFIPPGQEPGGSEGPVVRITQVDTTRFPKVVVYLSVTDAAGEPVGVSPSQLILEEDGIAIVPDAIGGSGEIGPLTTMLVMDVSGSMNSAGKLQAAKDAARAYVDQSRPGDQIGLMAFNTVVEYAQPITEDRQALLEAIDRLKAQKDTAMYDALALANEYLRPIDGRKAVIVLTDGLDNRSKITSLQVLEGIDPAGLSISTIGLGDPTQSKSAIGSLDEAALRLLAEKAGGSFGFANDAQSLQSLYERYGRALQSEYAITYTSPSKLRDGVNRALTVSLANIEASEGLAVTPASYNPGGLIPEVAEPASWGAFFALLGGLLVLLALPAIIRMGVGFFQSKGKPKSEPVKSAPRVKLKS